ncbi:MAG: AMP-binding protein [Bacteroidales bacterium]|nr:AMP-binding protein [Lentimicrobiaceae bacterium]MDD5694674.1 AMP-binding protein [Bacteroidales bacterium]
MGLKNFLLGTITEEDTYGFTLCDILKLRAENTPDKAAFIFLKDGESDEERITYKQLYDQAWEITHVIRSLGIQSGERALLLFPPGLEFVKTLFACFYAGIYAVPAYPPRKNRSFSRIISIVNDCNPQLCLTINEIRESFEKNFRDVQELRSLLWVSVDRESFTGNDFGYKIRPDDLAFLQYTSGSTASPKGVMVSHRNLMRNLEFLRQCYELTPDTRSVHWLPVYHDMGLIFGVIEAIYAGYTGILMPPVLFIQKPVRWLWAISRYGAALGGAPNFAYDLCATKTTDEDCQGLDLIALRTLYNGAETVRKDTLECFTERFKPYGFLPEKFHPTYGMAEATLILSGGRVSEKPVYLYVDKDALEKHRVVIRGEKDVRAACQVSVGKPWIDTRMLIVNPESLHCCREDEIGEIWVSGSIVAQGYWNKSEETAGTFHAFTADTGEGPFLRTGDLGFIYEGELYVTGRLKDLIILRGRNYYPQDIEYLAENSHPALRPNASAAFSVDLDGEERLVIVVEVERTSIRDLDVAEVCDAIRQQVGEELEQEVYAVQLLRTASILKTSSGKIQRRACKAAFLNHTLDVVGESKLDESQQTGKISVPSDEIVSIQSWLLAWIHGQLKVPFEQIDPDKPLTVYGLNSMKAVQLQNAFLQQFGINFPPYLFFEKITILELADRASKLIH